MKKHTEKNPPAFPTVMPGFCKEGMTLRQYYAGQALAGMMGNILCLKKGTDWIVDHAYNAADTMILRDKGLPPANS